LAGRHPKKPCKVKKTQPKTLTLPIFIKHTVNMKQSMPRRNKYDILKSEFVISNTDINLCPDDGKPEYAFIGRSNVGKSSLINMLCGRKKLAMTSARPGKTMLINHFLINDSWYIVDLPGYGYARRSKTDRDKFGSIISQYVNGRQALTCLFVLIDSRVAPQKIDIDFINDAGMQGIPLAIVFTKADRPNDKEMKANIEAMRKVLGETWEELPPMFTTSSLRKTGRDELLEYIHGINTQLNTAK